MTYAGEASWLRFGEWSAVRFQPLVCDPVMMVELLARPWVVLVWMLAGGQIVRVAKPRPAVSRLSGGRVGP